MTRLRIVTVICTGNICRSPMAYGFLQRHLAALGVDDVEVRSAGTHASTGNPAMGEAVSAAADHGVDLLTHRSTPLDVALVAESALILCATREHREFVLDHYPVLPAERVRLFHDALEGEEPVDVDDPYGWNEDVYRLAARVIDRAMGVWAERLAEGFGAAVAD